MFILIQFVRRQRRIHRRHTGRAPPVWNFLKRCIYVINLQCLQYVFYSLLSLQKHRVFVKGHQNNLQTSKVNVIPRRDSAPRFWNFWIRLWEIICAEQYLVNRSVFTSSINCISHSLLNWYVLMHIYH